MTDQHVCPAKYSPCRKTSNDQCELCLSKGTPKGWRGRLCRRVRIHGPAAVTITATVYYTVKAAGAIWVFAHGLGVIT